jgi:hypothetical protein
VRRLVAYALLSTYLIIVAACGLALQHAVHAQALADPVLAYTTADPVREGAIGLATHDGRFMVSRGDDCDASGIGPYMEVMYWRLEKFSGIGSLGVVDQQGIVHLCSIRVERLADPTPCFQDAEGDCDVAFEIGG